MSQSAKNQHIFKVLAIMALWGMPFLGKTQNLVPNYSFEDYKSCPSSFGAGYELDCEPWFNATGGTADYYNACSIVWVCDVPANYPGYQNARTGVAYTGILAKHGPPPVYWFEYIEIQLTAPLQFGKAYLVQFWVSLADKHCGLTHLGAYLSVGEVYEESPGVLELTPQVESNMGFLNDTANWTLIEGCMVAEGGEDHIIIGNFRSYGNTILEACNAPSPFNIQSYYFIDDVVVQEVPLEGLDVDLPDDVTVCYEYTIEPDAPADVHYLWSDGSTGPTLTVDETGLYKLTVYDGCLGGKDSIYVTIANQPDVMFNPDDTIICPGDVLTISLNPQAGDYEWNDGSNDATYSISTAGTYSVTLDDGCDLSEDEIEVEVLDPPAPFSLGSDTILCSGTEIEFNFDPELGDFTWQDGSHENSILIYEEGSYALTISNICGEFVEDLEVEELVPENVNLGPATFLFCTGDFLDISFDDTYATYVWQDGSTSPEYHISEAGTYSVTMTHACGVSEDSILITQIETPAVNLGGDINACPGAPVTLTASGLAAAFTWQDGSTNDSLIVMSTGEYAVTVENACGEDSDTIHVEFEDVIVQPELGVDFFLCPGEVAILQGDNPGANQVWQDGSTTDSLIVSAAGTYHVTVSNTCYSFSDTIQVIVMNEPPSINMPEQVFLCQGDIETLNPGVKGVFYLWNDGTTNGILNISNPGLYSLTVSNACGMDTDTVEVIDGGPLPIVLLGPDTSLCPGTAIVFDPVFSDVDAWLWQDGSTGDSFTAVDSGYVYVSVNNACGVNQDSLYIGLLPPAPIFQLAADTALCDGQQINLLIVNTGVDILWSDGTTNPMLTISEPGLYSAIISNACGEAADTMELFQLPAIPILNLGPDLPLCPGELITIDPGIENVVYAWQDGSGDTIYQIDQDQLVILSISNDCGVSTDTLEVFISTDGPDVELGDDLLACEGEVIIIQSNISGVDFLWQDGSTDPEFTTTVSGTFYVAVSNSCGSDADTVDVVINGLPPTPALGADTTLCEGHTLSLLSNADAETTIEWQDGSSVQLYTISSPGLYTLHEQNRCGEETDTILVSYLALPPLIDLGPDVTLCNGDSIVLEVPETTDEFAWQDGSTIPWFQASVNGVYSLTISNACGSTYDEMQLTYDNDALQLPEETEVVFCLGDEVELNVEQSTAASYTWSTGATSSSITVNTPGVYAVSIITECQEATHEVVVSYKPDCESTNEIYIPNVFSPNGDNINDEFIIFHTDGLELISIDGSIFDRWGDQVFQSTEIPFRWDGRFGDEKVMPGVYVYTVVLVYEVNQQVFREKITGDVTVLK